MAFCFEMQRINRIRKINYRNKKCRRYIPLLQGEYQPYPDASFSFHFPGIPVNQQLAVFYIILLGRTRANNVTSSGYASRSSSSIKMGTRRDITSLSPGGGGRWRYSRMWPIRGRAARQGMVFYLSASLY